MFVYTPYWSFCLWQKGGENFVFTLTPLLMIDKKGEKYFGLYACFPYFIIKEGEVFIFMHICFVLQMYGDKNLMSFMIVWHVVFAYMSYICIHVYVLHFHILLFIWYAWVKGELLWGFTLIHAYINPWVLSSSKRGRLLAQRPITLVLMMINSCSYSTNNLVFD